MKEETASRAASTPALKGQSNGECLLTGFTNTHTHMHKCIHTYVDDCHLFNDGLLYKQGALLKIAS